MKLSGPCPKHTTIGTRLSAIYDGAEKRNSFGATVRYNSSKRMVAPPEC